MRNRGHRELTLLGRLRYCIEEAKAQLQQARTKEELDLLNQKIGSLEKRQHDERVARRRQAALARRWERMNGPR